EAREEHARQREVVQVPSAAGQEARVLEALDARARVAQRRRVAGAHSPSRENTSPSRSLGEKCVDFWGKSSPPRTAACSSTAGVGAIRNAVWYLPSRASRIASARSAVYSTCVFASSFASVMPSRGRSNPSWRIDTASPRQAAEVFSGHAI